MASTRALRSASFRRLCSHMRTTRHPFSLRWTSCSRSLSMFRRILLSQYSRFVSGKPRSQIGHPCQKQPSTNIATFRPGNAKSGFPTTSLGLTSQPRKPLLASIARTFLSGVVFLLFTARMVRARSSADRLSGKVLSPLSGTSIQPRLY